MFKKRKNKSDLPLLVTLKFRLQYVNFSDVQVKYAQLHQNVGLLTMAKKFRMPSK